MEELSVTTQTRLLLVSELRAKVLLVVGPPLLVQPLVVVVVRELSVRFSLTLITTLEAGTAETDFPLQLLAPQ